MKTSLSRMFVLGAVGSIGVMTGVGCKTDVGDPATCRAAEAYLPTWSKEHHPALADLGRQQREVRCVHVERRRGFGGDHDPIR